MEKMNQDDLELENMEQEEVACEELEEENCEETDAESSEWEGSELLRTHGLTYTEKSRKLEDAQSSSGLFIVFGIIGLLAIAAVWLGIIPLTMAVYMKVLYTIVLGILFVVFIMIGIYYKKKIRILESETRTERRLKKEIISGITSQYSLEEIDAMIPKDSLSVEQLYFERYEKISSLIQEKYQIQDESFLDYLIEKIYQIYSPEE